MDFFKNNFDSHFYLNANPSLKTTSLNNNIFKQIWNHCDNFGWKENGYKLFKDPTIEYLYKSCKELDWKQYRIDKKLFNKKTKNDILNYYLNLISDKKYIKNTYICKMDNNLKISIVMAYYNRKEQTIETLNSFANLYQKYNFEVIIIDDNSNDKNKLEDIIKNYSFSINIITIDSNEKELRVNPCIAYNKGFTQSTGDIIIIQNPECYHVGDIIGHTLKNLKESDYFSYSCFTSNSFEHNNELLSHHSPYELIQDPAFNKKNYELINLSWYNHPHTEEVKNRDVGYHFCSSIYKSKLDLIGGFSTEYKDGYCFDDDDFLLCIKYNLNQNIQIIDPSNGFVIHQFHTRNDSFNIETADDTNIIKQKWLKNKTLLETTKINHENKKFNYPKLLHLYWDGSPMSYLNYITVLSFNEFHIGWKINVFMPIKKTDTISWTTDEQKTKYNGVCYFEELKKISNVNIQYIDLNKIGFYNNASEVIKSDYFRYYILEKHGGLWSDFDIIYTSSIEDKIQFNEDSCIFYCTDCGFTYFPIGLLLSKPNTKLYKFILNKCIENYDTSQYQSIGATMWKKLFTPIENLHKIDNSVKLLNEDYYLPLSWNKISALLYNKNFVLPKNNIGIHFFNGTNEIKTYLNNTSNKINFLKPTCYFDKVIYYYYNKYNNHNTQLNCDDKMCYNFNNQTIDNINKTLYTDITLIFNYTGQIKKTMLFLENMKIVYINTNYNIYYHIINNNSTSIDEPVISYLNNGYNYSIFNNLNDAIIQSPNDKIVFQDLIVTHTNNILNTLLFYSNDYEVTGLRKIITNKNLSTDYLLKIRENILPDVICFSKNIFNIHPGFKINSKYINQNVNYTEFNCFNISYLFPNKIPKKIHFYWDGSKGCYLTNLALKSFIINNPDWEINLWMPNIPFKGEITWESQEFIPPHNVSYDDIDYLNYEHLKSNGVNVRHIDYFNLSLSQNINEILKSDIFRWKILSTEGGVWADLDIMFIDKMEKIDFDNHSCFFHNIDFVVSQYQKTIEDVAEPINFYYIGLLMSSENNSFYKIMYEESLKNINSSKYQNVGGDLMKSYFGLYNNIQKKIGHANYANLNSSSIYKYWWGDLKNMFINNSQQNIHDYSFANNNVVGYHWFRGVQLSKIYCFFLNYKNKIQNFNFNGPVPLWVEYYKTIFNDFKLITHQKKISIVMGYINRLPQLENTLKTIQKSKHTNYEIIIVNDGTENLKYLKDKYTQINIKIIENSNKTNINPCMSYNLGAIYATGDIILLQNPECCHIGDVLTTTNAYLKENNYLAFSSFYLDTFEKNNLLNNLLNENNTNEEYWDINRIKKMLMFTLDNKKNCLPDNYNGWSSHHFYNKNYLHFCCAIFKKDFFKLNSFSNEYANGICFDDDDLVRKILYNHVKCQYFCISNHPNSYPSMGEHATFVIHQHHDRFKYTDDNIMDKWNDNKNIFIDTNINYVRQYLSYYINKNILDNCTYTTNFQIINADVTNSINKMVFKFDKFINNNFITYNPFIKNKVLSYEFNGHTLKLTNNIIELFNDCTYNIIIKTNATSFNVCVCDTIDEIKLINNGNFNIIENTKINIEKITISNICCDDENLVISCECILNEITNIDNTIFENI